MSELWGEEAALAIQLGIEYRPAPPLSLGVAGGDPDAVPVAVRARAEERAHGLRARRAEVNTRVARGLKGVLNPLKA